MSSSSAPMASSSAAPSAAAPTAGASAARIPSLPPELIRKIVMTRHRRVFTAPDPTADNSVEGHLKEMMGYARVSRAWADAVIDEYLWNVVWEEITDHFVACVAPPDRLGRRWNELLRDIPVAYAPTADLSEAAKRAADGAAHGRTTVALHVYYRKGRPPGGKFPALWDQARTAFREHATALQLGVRALSPHNYFEADGDHSDSDAAPDDEEVCLPKSIGLADFVDGAPFPKLEWLMLARVWGGLSVLESIRGADTPADVARMVEAVVNEKLATRPADEVVFPALRFVRVERQPGLFDLGLAEKLAPNLTHWLMPLYPEHQDRLPIDTPFLAQPRRYRVYVHADWAQCYAWPGPASGTELRASWRRWFALSEIVRRKPWYRVQDVYGEVAVVERRDDGLYWTKLAVDDLFRTTDLQNVPLQRRAALPRLEVPPGPHGVPPHQMDMGDDGNGGGDGDVAI